MPRKQKQEIVDLNRIRADNYKSHLQKRRFVLALDPGFQQQAKKSIDLLPHTDLNLFGVDNYQPHEWTQIFKVSIALGLEPAYCNWWWWSDEGWAAFQKLWEELPEFVHIPLCTNNGVVLLCTQDQYVYPSDPG